MASWPRACAGLKAPWVIPTLVAAIAAALLVLPPPTQLASHVAIFFDEDALPRGRRADGRRSSRASRGRGGMAADRAGSALGVGIVAVALVPPFQSLRAP